MRGEFTLSYHFFRQCDLRNHLELFLDIDGVSPLETWRHFTTRKSPARPLRFTAAPEHRRVYLMFAGEVSGARGRLRILRRGKFIDNRSAQKKRETMKVVL
ncbi:MAG TPA: hypothetical protein PLY93_08295 [Turneriella sp.]|nr:hypothetical protein [Turneriella sp.]